MSTGWSLKRSPRKSASDRPIPCKSTPIEPSITRMRSARSWRRRASRVGAMGFRMVTFVMGEERLMAETLPVFRERFGIDPRALDAAFAHALERPVDHADLFFEYTSRDAVALEEGIVKSGSRAVEQGVGVRAQAGERQGYAHSDEITVESVKLAAGAAR